MVKNKKKAGDNTKIHILKKSDRIKFVQKKTMILKTLVLNLTLVNYFVKFNTLIPCILLSLI